MFNTIQEVLEELKNGRMVIVMDDEGRENEGDVLIAAEHITPEAINFMATYARGLICVPMEDGRLGQLDLHAMKEDSNSKHSDNNSLPCRNAILASRLHSMSGLLGHAPSQKTFLLRSCVSRPVPWPRSCRQVRTHRPTRGKFETQTYPACLAQASAPPGTSFVKSPMAVT